MNAMRICIDARSLFAPIASGIPEYTRLAISSLLEVSPREEFIFLTKNHASLRSVMPELPKGTKENCVSFCASDKLLTLGEFILRLPRLDKKVTTDVYWSPNIEILSFAQPEKHILTIHDLSFVFFKEFFKCHHNVVLLLLIIIKPT